jgi:ribosomal protein S18 acetylase RimI-like enzyme
VEKAASRVLSVVSKLKDSELILGRLYKDCVCHVEEISLIEEDYLWRGVNVYVDNNKSPQDFLIFRSYSLHGEKNISAYMAADAQSSIQGFSDILRLKKDWHMHLQASPELEASIRKSMGWLINSYNVRYCRADSRTFKPYHMNEKGSILLTPDDIKGFKSLSSPHLVKRAKTAPIYGFLNEKGEMVASSGVGFLTKKSFSISYTETSPEYRNRGIAKYLTSLASEPLIDKGLVGVYCADIKNEPSTKVANALGFIPYKDLLCFFN